MYRDMYTYMYIYIYAYIDLYIHVYVRKSFTYVVAACFNLVLTRLIFGLRTLTPAFEEVAYLGGSVQFRTVLAHAEIIWTGLN